MDSVDKNSPLIHTIDKSEDSLSYGKFGLLVLTAIVIGALGGFLIRQLTTSSDQSSAKGVQEKSGKAAGIADKKTFKDKAEGKLKEGGIEGEGNFHLERPGGKSQNVYLTSSTVDLSKYIGKKVRVWGETFQAEKAGWLMDVGLIEILQ